MEKDNANPTILNTSQLPTRQPRTGTASSTGRGAPTAASPLPPPPYFDDQIYKLEHGFSPFIESDSDSDFTYEPIDEQEIFGVFLQQ